jgi:hypothetical protein
LSRPLYVNDPEACRNFWVEKVDMLEEDDMADNQGTRSFAFSDPEGHWFAVTQ